MGLDVTRILQTEINDLMTSWETMKDEVIDISKAYWSTDANSQIASASATQAVTLSSYYIKTEYSSGITLLEDMEDFFIGDPVTKTDYRQTCHKLRYGSAATPAKLSEATEDLGARMKVVAVNSLTAFNKCQHVLKIYNENEVGDMIANLDVQRAIPGSEMTKDDLNSGITMVEQFKKMLNNEDVNAADYSVTMAKWRRL